MAWPIKYLLMTSTSAAEVQRMTGLRRYDTPLGVLVEDWQPPPIDRLMTISKPRGCTCGAYAVIHRSDCPVGNAIT